MTASKMKKYPTLSSTASSLLPTNHEQNTSSSSLSSSLKYYRGKTSSSSSKRKHNSYLSSVNELTILDDSSDKQVSSSFDNMHYVKGWESKLNLPCCHGLERHIKEKDTMTPHSFPSNEQHKIIANKVSVGFIYYNS